ncbi:MAG: hypothetical protein JNL77_10975, partial [Nitrosomonas sp.]|nr:hypothetical protein [Nitrosomonas sp.]
MLDTVTGLKELIEPGLLGNYTWFEAIEVIAFSLPVATGETLVRNIFSIYVAESGEPYPEPKQPFLNQKSKKLKKLKGWNFGVTKRPLQITKLLECIEHYGRTGVWIPRDQKALQVGELVAAPAM